VTRPNHRSKNKLCQAQIRAVVPAQAPEESEVLGSELRFCISGLDFVRRTFAKILNKLQQIYVAHVVPGSTGLARWQKQALTSLRPSTTYSSGARQIAASCTRPLCLADRLGQRDVSALPGLWVNQGSGLPLDWTLWDALVAAQVPAL
jgi:hypothetical protein